MNMISLTSICCLLFSISIYSCSETSEKTSTPVVTSSSKPSKPTLPPHTYTYNAKTKSKTAASGKTATAKNSTEVNTLPNSTSVSTVQPSSPPSQTQTINSGKIGTVSNPTSTTTNTQNTSQNSGTGKTKIGTGGSGSSGGGGNVLDNLLGGSTGGFTEGDAASAIKEALMKGVTAGVKKVAVTDGYFKNSIIKIPFPDDAKVVETTLRKVGMGKMIDDLVLSLNRAAESAANQAGPIFLNGIKQMTVNDAIGIVNNQQPDAATKFLQRTTTEGLVAAFKPPIQTALDKTLATKYWKDIMTYYNKVPFVKKVNTDLNDFVTRKAISGLFYMVGQEEAKIRKDPLGQGSKIIESVFGSVLKR